MLTDQSADFLEIEIWRNRYFFENITRKIPGRSITLKKTWKIIIFSSHSKGKTLESNYRLNGIFCFLRRQNLCLNIHYDDLNTYVTTERPSYDIRMFGGKLSCPCPYGPQTNIDCLVHRGRGAVCKVRGLTTSGGCCKLGGLGACPPEKFAILRFPDFSSNTPVSF